MSYSTLRPVARAATRYLHTSASSRAAAATAAAPRTYVRKFPVKAAAPVSTTSAAASPASAPAPPSFADILPPPPPPPAGVSEVADYAKLKSARSSQPDTANPLPEVPIAPSFYGATPQGSFPNDYYRPPTGDAAQAKPAEAPGSQHGPDWMTSFAGISASPFPPEIADKLLAPLTKEDIECKPDGLLYLPEIKYRRRLTSAFGPGAWGLVPRGETHVSHNIVSREWGLICLGRLVAVARGEQEYFDPSGIPTATEACKSNALMRCCKDLGIASDLWDPTFIRKFKAENCVEVYAEHATKKTKRKLWRKKGDPPFQYPYKESK